MRNRTLDPQPGIPARYPADCKRCNEGIAKGDRIVFEQGDAVHAACYMRDHS